MEQIVLNVSDALALINQTLDYAYPSIVIEGEVASFKVNQNKYVFFDIKDEAATLGCFMSVYALRVPIENGMKVRIIAQPKITQWGKFSLTVRTVQPIGEGSLKRAYDMLLQKLTAEGLFDEARKRALPTMPQRIGVVSSTAAAGYKDFIKILNERWGGAEVIVAHTQVQGEVAPDQMIRALAQLNQLGEPLDVIALIRGGGSLDDLSAFNDEQLVRAVSQSRVPVIAGIGHEVDTSLVDLAADVRAATPSNAAQILVPDKQDVLRHVMRDIDDAASKVSGRITTYRETIDRSLRSTLQRLESQYRHQQSRHTNAVRYFEQLNPRVVLKRGYSLLRGPSGAITDRPRIGDEVTIETFTSIINAGVTHVENK